MIEKPRIEMSTVRDVEPIVDNPRRPEMSDRASRPRRISGKVLLMANEPSAPRPGKNQMQPLPKRAKSERQSTKRPDQQAPEVRRAGQAEPEEGYIRLRVHVQDGEMSVQDIAAVDGPLVANEPLHGDFAWEALLSGERVASGSVPDAGVRRAFPPRSPAPGQTGHFFTTAPSFDFMVRIPKELVTESKLRRLEVPIYRIKEGGLPRTEGPEPLTDHFSREIREIGRLRGVQIAQLPKAAQSRARRALR
jgi:hypothetical protein